MSYVQISLNVVRNENYNNKWGRILIGVGLADQLRKTCDVEAEFGIAVVDLAATAKQFAVAPHQVSLLDFVVRFISLQFYTPVMPRERLVCKGVLVTIMGMMNFLVDRKLVSFSLICSYSYAGGFAAVKLRWRLVTGVTDQVFAVKRLTAIAHR